MRGGLHLPEQPVELSTLSVQQLGDLLALLLVEDRGRRQHARVLASRQRVVARHRSAARHRDAAAPGGGVSPRRRMWVLASAGVYIASARALAQKLDAVVASANYRLAPDPRLSAQLDDAFAAYRAIRAMRRRWAAVPSA